MSTFGSSHTHRRPTKFVRETSNVTDKARSGQPSGWIECRLMADCGLSQASACDRGYVETSTKPQHDARLSLPMRTRNVRSGNVTAQQPSLVAPPKNGCVRVDRRDESPSPAFKIKIRHTSVHDNPDAQTQRSRCRLNQLCERLAARSTVPSNFSLSAVAEKYRARADSLVAIQDQAKRDFARSPLTE